jgi:hypothetical protein
MDGDDKNGNKTSSSNNNGLFILLLKLQYVSSMIRVVKYESQVDLVMTKNRIIIRLKSCRQILQLSPIEFSSQSFSSSSVMTKGPVKKPECLLNPLNQ